MNFHLLRFMGIFAAAIVGVLVLIIIEGFVSILIADLGPVGIFPSGYKYLYLVAILTEPIWINFPPFLLLSELAAFALAAYMEGFYYGKKQSVRPRSIHLLTASTAMAVVGLMIVLAFLLLFNVTIGEGISFGPLQLDPTDVYYLAVTIVTCTVICRVFLGWGLREMRSSELKLSSENP
ncbi:hypothetical protein [Roseibium sp. RKSG952]|uniref:hypothetical protein n=1 Tax=Roseibium sp. RKSG952 TaxID=2529384 RepID=UPI0012BD6469|nr:hypothetical protein [Roseibium sp. RKSG952]MTH98677.1 hypothetical protein [Roseibium sp. RKSG952]